jgi:hypothetical protein
MKIYMFRTVPLSTIRRFSLYTRQWYVSHRFADSLRAVLSSSCSQFVSTTVWHIPLLCVQWKTPNYGQMNCLKHVDFHSKNKFEKLVHVVGLITRKFIMMHGQINVKLMLKCFLWPFNDVRVKMKLMSRGVRLEFRISKCLHDLRCSEVSTV